MNGKELTEALHSGRQLYGTLITSPAPKWVEVLEGIDMDCVFIDTEHIPMNWYELGWMCRAFKAIGLAPIVRIPKADSFDACRVFDAGATGIVAAYIETVEQVNQLRSAAKLRPLKGKRLEQILSGKAKLEGELADYIEKLNEDRVLFVNIESVPALEALDEILAVPGLDAVLIGPSDLSCSLGVPKQFDHPLFEKAMSEIIRKARAKNIGVGCHNLPRIDQEIRYAKEGMNLILRRADMTLFQDLLQSDLKKLRAGLGEKAEGEGSGEIEL